jgi:hypothetical protein
LNGPAWSDHFVNIISDRFQILPNTAHRIAGGSGQGENASGDGQNNLACHNDIPSLLLL